MSPDLLHILQHSLGVDQYGRGRQYRSHFVAGPGHCDYDKCVSLCEGGFMERHDNPHVVGGVVFVVTDAGRKAVAQYSPAPPKLTRSQRRYQAWLDADSGYKFGDWIKMKTAAGGLP